MYSLVCVSWCVVGTAKGTDVRAELHCCFCWAEMMRNVKLESFDFCQDDLFLMILKEQIEKK